MYLRACPSETSFRWKTSNDQLFMFFKINILFTPQNFSDFPRIKKTSEIARRNDEDDG